MVLAVPIMEQEPGPGSAAFSISVSSSRVSLPILTCPANSRMVERVISLCSL